MLENEELSGQVESGESQASSEPSEPVESKEAAPAAKQESDQNTPFHEHPRFKELVEQKNAERSQREALEAKLAQFEERFTKMSQPAKQEDPLIARLKQIDPEFGERFEKLNASQQELAELREWRQNYESSQIREKAVSSVQTLHSENKVTPELKSLIESDLIALDSQGKLRGLADIPAAYKASLEKYTRLIDGIRRSEREGYVKAKSQDASSPTSQPKGKAAPNASNSKFQGNREDARAQLIKSVLKQSKASNSL